MQAKDISVGGRFRKTDSEHVYTRVLPTFLLPSLGFWSSTKGLGQCLSISDGHIFAVNDIHQLIAIHPDNSVRPARDDGPLPGYEAIEIDGVACEIGWCEGQWDEYWCVIRHGCEIGKGGTRERAIEEARSELANTPWLRGPKPDHFGKPA
jgi:hypothetical protein